MEVLVYGATCIFQSKRALINNYYDFTAQSKDAGMEERLVIAEPGTGSVYSIYEDRNGTHLFAAADVNLLPHLEQLASARLTHWKLDGFFVKGERSVR